jgi:hypothetical protein
MLEYCTLFNDHHVTKFITHLVRAYAEDPTVGEFLGQRDDVKVEEPNLPIKIRNKQVHEKKMSHCPVLFASFKNSPLIPKVSWIFFSSTIDKCHVHFAVEAFVPLAVNVPML